MRNWRTLLDAKQVGKTLREIARRQHEVRHSGRDDAARHGGPFGLVWVLHQNDAACLLDGANADRAVGASATQNNSETIANPLRY